MADPETAVAAELARLRNSYLERLPAELTELDRMASALQGGRDNSPILGELHQRLHKLVGSGGTFGLASLSNQARALEKTAKAWLNDGIDGLDGQALQGFIQNVAALHSALQDAQAPHAEILQPMAAQHDGRAVHVCLVEDDVLLGQAIQRILGQYGYEVHLITCLDEAMARLAQTRPDVLIMDVMFHGEGLNATEVASRLPIFQNLTCPLLFISAYDDFESRVRAVRLGAIGYLAKPLDLSRLVDRLERLFDDRQDAPYRVLIVDDDLHLAEHFRLVLTAAGMEATVCSDPKTVLEAVSQNRPELVLMDMHMPDYNGAELASVIRMHDEWLGLHIAYLSAESDLDEQIKALGHGADDFLTKPISDAQLVAAVKVRAARSRQLGDLMSRDSLTGLLKHARIKEELASELKRGQRLSKPVSVVMADIDHFKQVNDTWGHATGDRIIKAVSQILKQRLRKSDSIGRYGGEEFMAVLPECDANSAKTLMDNIRQQFAALRFIQEGDEFSVTLSAGIACTESGIDPSQILVAADVALYQAKHGGRNQVCVYSDGNIEHEQPHQDQSGPVEGEFPG